jgi:ribosomal protein S18 acetylase RimI-like enzyme
MVLDADGLLIRRAVLEDLSQLVEIDREVRLAPDQPSHAADWLEPDAATHLRNWIAAGECYIAAIGDMPVGYAVLHYHFFHSGIIDLVIVKASHRRRGIGRALVRYLAERCTSEKVWISTNLSNTRMQALLAGESFAMCGFIEGLDEGDPELVYSKPTKKR